MARVKKKTNPLLVIVIVIALFYVINNNNLGTQATWAGTQTQCNSQLQDWLDQEGQACSSCFEVTPSYISCFEQYYGTYYFGGLGSWQRFDGPIGGECSLVYYTESDIASMVSCPRSMTESVVCTAEDNFCSSNLDYLYECNGGSYQVTECPFGCAGTSCAEPSPCNPNPGDEVIFRTNIDDFSLVKTSEEWIATRYYYNGVTWLESNDLNALQWTGLTGDVACGRSGLYGTIIPMTTPQGHILAYSGSSFYVYDSTNCPSGYYSRSWYKDDLIITPSPELSRYPVEPYTSNCQEVYTAGTGCTELWCPADTSGNNAIEWDEVNPAIANWISGTYNWDIINSVVNKWLE